MSADLPSLTQLARPMLTPDDLREALAEAFRLGLTDGRQRELEYLIEETTAKLTADLSPVLGGGPGPIERRVFEPKARPTPPSP
jgi:hypothetical protein